MNDDPDPARHQVGRDYARGTGAALQKIYPPDAAADADLDRLIERLEAVPSTKKGGKDGTR